MLISTILELFLIEYLLTMHLAYLSHLYNVFFLDINRFICLAGVIKRQGKKRSDTAIDHYHDEKFDKRFIGFCKGIINFNKTRKIRIIDLHKKYFEKTFLVINSRRKMNELLNKWRDEKTNNLS